MSYILDTCMMLVHKVDCPYADCYRIFNTLKGALDAGADPDPMCLSDWEELVQEEMRDALAIQSRPFIRGPYPTSGPSTESEQARVSDSVRGSSDG